LVIKSTNPVKVLKINLKSGMKIPSKTNVSEIKNELEKRTKENLNKIYNKWTQKEFKEEFSKKYSKNSKELKSKVDEIIPRLIQYFPNEKLGKFLRNFNRKGIIFTNTVPEFILEKEITIEKIETIIQQLGKENEEKLNEIMKNVNIYLNDEENEENV
jgi:hypothetical protein